MTAPINLPEDRFMRAALLPIVDDAIKLARNTVMPFSGEPFVSAIIETLRTFETSQMNRERSAPVSPAPEVVTEVPVDAERERLTVQPDYDNQEWGICEGDLVIATCYDSETAKRIAAALRSSTPVAPTLDVNTLVKERIADMEACRVFICYDCRTYEFFKDLSWHLEGCKKCGARGVVLPFMLREPAPVAPVVSACEKCGGLDIGTRFFREGAEGVQPSTRFDWRDCRWSNIPSGCVNQHGSLETTRDLLRRNCRTCGWWWTEPVRTSTDTPTPSEAKQ